MTCSKQKQTGVETPYEWSHEYEHMTMDLLKGVPACSPRASYVLGTRAVRSNAAVPATATALNFSLSLACKLLLWHWAMFSSSCMYLSWSRVMTCKHDRLLLLQVVLSESALLSSRCKSHASNCFVCLMFMVQKWVYKQHIECLLQSSWLKAGPVFDARCLPRVSASLCKHALYGCTPPRPQRQCAHLWSA